MKKLFFPFFFLAISSFCNFSYAHEGVKERFYNYLAHCEFYHIIDDIKKSDTSPVLLELSRSYLAKTFFPGLDRFVFKESFVNRLERSEDRDIRVLRYLGELEVTHPLVRPFIKHGYKEFKVRYKKKPIIKSHRYGIPFPSEKVIESYPDAFEEGTEAAVVLGPLLKPGKLTKTKYEKNIEDYEKSQVPLLKFFLQNRSNILFPGSTDFMDMLIDSEKYGTFLKKVKNLSTAQDLSKPDKKRDLAILENFWRESINAPDLVSLIKRGHENFEKAYHCKAPVRSIFIKKGVTLGNYVDQHPKSPVAALCNTLEPAPSKLLRNTLILGALSGIAYVIYKKYETHTNHNAPSSLLKTK